jgi:hypothetical protein
VQIGLVQPKLTEPSVLTKKQNSKLRQKKLRLKPEHLVILASTKASASLASEQVADSTGSKGKRRQRLRRLLCQTLPTLKIATLLCLQQLDSLYLRHWAICKH